ncbi:lactonase family protein [Novosphingobium sp. 9]|uniref:lactonase family protein n=1 Tax=Novosphingobium sp. 9 TaxID=2025349 RepID=UPI0021B65A9D|nr:lactonase family protein [Novosphingobium sp. 9]
MKLDPRTGALTSQGVVGPVERPTWVLADTLHRHLFSVSEVGNDGKDHGAVLSFAYDPATGALRPLGRADSGGGGATHLALDGKGRTVYVANYGSGQIAAIPIDAQGRVAAMPSDVEAHTGSGPSPRQKSAHAHGVTVDPSGRYLLSPDLGTDRIYIYRIGAGGSLTPAKTPWAALPPGSGPRHIVFAPDGRHAFLMTEMGGTIYAFNWNAEVGSLAPVASTPLDGPEFTGKPSGSEIALSRDGRFLYAGNRAANRVQVYAVGKDGHLTFVQALDCGGQVPWGFALSHDGRWLVVANQMSNNLSVFRIDAASGKLDATGQRLDIARPTSVAFTDR